MAWIPGGGVIITATNTKQVLTATNTLVKVVRIFPDPSNTHNIYVGDSTLDPTTSPKTGLAGWIPPPPASPNSTLFWEAFESQSVNGIYTGLIYVAGTAGEILYWSYIQQ